MPAATEQAVYSTVIQLTLGTVAGPATINNGTITSVTGLPTGLSASWNPGSGVINAGASGCIHISGTPAVGSSGTYTVTANVTVSTNLGSSPTTLTWSLTVSAATGIFEQSAPAPTLVITPNPAKSEVNLTSGFHFQTIRIFDVLGNIALSQQVNGAYKTTVDVGTLSPGIYFLQITDGNTMATRKFIKE
ncbi:MAG: T9SS type A sorting domain-containing protein [Bacteroidia bacterium]